MRRVAIAVGIALSAALVVLFFAHAAYVFFVLVAAVLFSISVWDVSAFLAKKTKLPYAPIAALVLLLVLAATIGSTVLLGRPLWKQTTALFAELPKLLEKASQLADKIPGGHALVHSGGDASGGAKEVAQKAPAVATGLIEAIASLVVFFFVGAYGAISPKTYVDGFLALLPPMRRPRARQILEELRDNLARWLFARLVAMVMVGVLSVVGLMLLKIPMALALGLIAGLFTFVDYAGAVASAVPPIVVALAKSPAHALYVVILYVVIHVLEGYVLTPWLVKRAVKQPPAFTLGMQTVFGAAFGIMGVAFATPLTIVGVILIQQLYVRRMESRAIRDGAILQGKREMTSG